MNVVNNHLYADICHQLNDKNVQPIEPERQGIEKETRETLDSPWDEDIEELLCMFWTEGQLGEKGHEDQLGTGRENGVE